MNIFKIFTVFTVLFLLPFLSQSQNENVDLGMVYKIKQEGLKNSGIEEMAFWLIDFVGPRLTGSTGNNHGNEWAKKKMEELGLQNVRIEPAREFSRGGWDNQKTYAAMISPYYTSFACNPVAWTGSTAGTVKGEVLFLNVKTEADLEKYKGKLSGKIVMMPSVSNFAISFDPLASRLTNDQLKDLVRPIFEEWLKPFADMGASTTTIRNTSGTDHLAFDAVGLPGFQFIQDAIEYGRGYHTTMDTYERLVMDDLKQNAVITASFVYNAAMRQAKLPGKPVMKARPENDRRLP